MSKQTNAKKKKRRVGKPNAFLWHLIVLLLRPYYRLRYGMKLDLSGVKDLKGPALVVAPHTSGKDHFLVAFALAKHRPTFVLSAHFMANPKLRWALKLLHVITKKMFCADAHTIMDILRAKNEGNVIVLFPEGRLPACGHSMPLAKGTAELVKKLGIPVYCVTGNGAYLTFPKWAKQPRRGRISVTTQKLFTPEELGTSTVEEIQAKLDAAVCHNDESAMAGVAYHCRDMTLGLDGILRRCPVCGKVGSLVTEKGHIRCECGLDATLDNTYVLHGAPFERLNDWFDWQQGQIDPMQEVLEDEMSVGAIDQKGNLQKGAGEGIARLDATAFTFQGKVFGEDVHFSVPTSAIGGLPVTVADHFDIYHAGVLYHMYPKSDRRSVIDWVCFVDAYNARKETGENV